MFPHIKAPSCGPAPVDAAVICWQSRPLVDGPVMFSYNVLETGLQAWHPAADKGLGNHLVL